MTTLIKKEKLKENAIMCFNYMKLVNPVIFFISSYKKTKHMSFYLNVNFLREFKKIEDYI